LTGEKARRLIATLVVAAFGAAFLAACGGSASGSDQFRSETGSALLNFGEEGSGGELEEAEETVHSFFLARSQEDWQTACAQLSRGMLAKIEHLATSATDLADKSCPSFLGAFTSLSAQERRDSTVIEAGGVLRQRDTKGFLIYFGAGKVVYAMPLSKEGGAWKVGSLSSKVLD
jgi:hypothetical protein